MLRLIDYMGLQTLPGFSISRSRVISEDDYDITPKPHLIKKQVQELQEKINLNKRLRDMTVKRYDDEISDLEAKMAELQGSTKKKEAKK